MLKKINSKITTKIAILVTIQAVFIIGSVLILAYYQSQGIFLGNSVNIAGKNRFLTYNVWLHTEQYLSGSSNITALETALDKMESNLVILKEGGQVSSSIELKPLSSQYINLWEEINNKFHIYKNFIVNNVIKPFQEGPSPRTSDILNQTAKREIQTMSLDLVNSSDLLTTHIGNGIKNNSVNLMLLEIFLGILNIAILILILYFVIRMLKPIFALTTATAEIKKGNLDVSVRHTGNKDDELAALTELFNSMISSLRNYVQKQNELTAELKSANEQLSYQDRLKDEFINIAAHELRSPIQPILGLSSFLQSQAKDDIKSEVLIDSLDVINRNAKRLKQLSDNILDVARIGSYSLRLNKEIFKLDDILKNVIQDYDNEISHTQGNVKLFYHFNIDDDDDDTILVKADKQRIIQVISNLINNALKFRDRNGETVISVNIKKKEERNGQQVALFSIQDSGNGIDPEIFPKLFEKFTSRSYQGTGLGLFISKSIIQAHGGKIWAENNIDHRGATFYFTLPIN